METFSGSTESPTVQEYRKLVRDIVHDRDRLLVENIELQDLLREIASRHMLLVDKRYEGQFSTRLNKALGL